MVLARSRRDEQGQNVLPRSAAEINCSCGQLADSLWVRAVVSWALAARSSSEPDRHCAGWTLRRPRDVAPTAAWLQDGSGYMEAESPNALPVRKMQPLIVCCDGLNFPTCLPRLSAAR